MSHASYSLCGDLSNLKGEGLVSERGSAISLIDRPILYQAGLYLKYQVLINSKAARCFCENLNPLRGCLFLD
jgi:hypothetical protein